MRFMLMFKPGEGYEAGQLPDEASITAMGHVLAEMAERGVLLAGEGLKPTSSGVRLELEAGKGRVLDGPFTETKELIAGFCLIEVASRDEAVEWGWRCLAADSGNSAGLEIRQAFAAEDFGDTFTPEAQAIHEKAWAKAAENLAE
jgi:hypothetical protein